MYILTSPEPLNSSDVIQLKYGLQQVCVSSALYGIQAALAIATIPVLARRRGSAWTLMASAFALYIMSTTGAVVLIVNRLIEVPTLGPHAPNVEPLSYVLFLVYTLSTRLTFLLSDGIVIWRAWVMWPRSRIVRTVVVVCMLGSAIGLVLDGVWYMKGLWTGEPSLQTLSFTIPIFMTNTVSTSLVGIQLWLHRRDISALLGPYATGSRVAGALLLLFESGVIYCAFCCSILILDIMTPSLMLRIDSVVLFRCALPPLCGIYPLVVILVITAQQHTITQRMQEAGPSLWESIRFETRSGGVQTQDAAQLTASRSSEGREICAPPEEIELEGAIMGCRSSSAARSVT